MFVFAAFQERECGESIVRLLDELPSVGEACLSVRRISPYRSKLPDPAFPMTHIVSYRKIGGDCAKYLSTAPERVKALLVDQRPGSERVLGVGAGSDRRCRGDISIPTGKTW